MTDIQKLKALAEAAPTGPWHPPDEYSHKGMVFDCDLGSLLRYESIDTERDACVAYVAAANPAAVLELIAEIEGIRDAYTGAREDLQEWKRRALEAEEKVRAYGERIVALGVLGMQAAVSKPSQGNARCATCDGRKTVPPKDGQKFWNDCPDCCGEEG